MFLGYLFRHCFTIFVPNFWDFLSLTFRNFGIFVPNFWQFLSPTFGDLGIFVPNFWWFLPQLLGIWEFLSPKVGDKNSQTVGDNNSIPMGIIIVPQLFP